jgi:hypothetical protein
MPVSLAEFVKHLEDSGILAGDTIQDFIPPKGNSKDAGDLARELVRSTKLTQFQAEQVAQGKGKSLVLGNYVLLAKIGAGGMGEVFNLSRTCSRLRDQAGLPRDLVLYLARHECGTKICRAKGIEYARRLLGHTNIRIW